MDASRVATLRGLVDQLAACEEALQGCVDDAQRKLGPQGKFAPVTAQTHVVLALARALGRTTYAPHGWPHNVADNEARRHVEGLYSCLRPPVPTEQHLQASLLHTQPAVDTQPAGLADAGLESGMLAQAHTAFGDVAGGVEKGSESLEALLALLPPRPPGWKPGDALPDLPPLSGAAASAVADAVAAAAAAQAEKEAGGLVFVPRVALEDLNPDLDVEFDVVDAGDEDDDDMDSDSD